MLALPVEIKRFLCFFYICYTVNNYSIVSHLSVHAANEIISILPLFTHLLQDVNT